MPREHTDKYKTILKKGTPQTRFTFPPLSGKWALLLASQKTAEAIRKLAARCGTRKAFLKKQTGNQIKYIIE